MTTFGCLCWEQTTANRACWVVTLVDEKGQGATEYLLMVAVALIIVAVAIYWLLPPKEPAVNVISNRLNNIETQMDQAY
ncbi:MAG: hypothetical protein DRO11_08600 [Methanobacteriota archaeon]|nr:MAG: hypothetical protein DRO11_08600 [Euryarchaeota archaeon]